MSDDIYRRLADKPWLYPLETSVYEIPERVKEFGDDLCVVYNSIRGKYEIHSTENIGSTHCFSVPTDQLDCRVLDMVRQYDLRTRGKQIFREMESHNERLERLEYQRRQRELRAMAMDVRRDFAKLAWEM